MLGTLDFTGLENQGSFQFFLEPSLDHWVIGNMFVARVPTNNSFYWWFYLGKMCYRHHYHNHYKLSYRSINNNNIFTFFPISLGMRS